MRRPKQKRKQSKVQRLTEERDEARMVAWRLADMCSNDVDVEQYQATPEAMLVLKAGAWRTESESA